MKRIIIHIGYPKTATTTLEDGLFVGLHHLGAINYLGRADYSKDKKLNKVALSIRNHLYYNHEIEFRDIVLRADLLNIISDDTYTHPGSYKERALNISVDPMCFPKKLANIFHDLADDITILVTIRNQQTLIYSQYVQKYRLFANDINNNIPEKHLFNRNTELKKENLAIYYFSTVANEYAKYFGKENVKIALFEDFQFAKVDFIRQISKLINIDESLIEKLLEGKHFREKVKTYEGYVTEIDHQTKFYSLLQKLQNVTCIKSIYYFIKNRFGNENIITRTITSYSKRKQIFVIPTLTNAQREIIYHEFKESNKLLAEEFGVDYVKLKKYGYI